MASARTNKLRKRDREAPWRSIRNATSQPLTEPDQAHIAYKQGFEQQRNLTAFATSVGNDSTALGFALTRREFARRRDAAEDSTLLPPFGWKVISLLPYADLGLSHLGAQWPWVAGTRGKKTWPDDLRENVDAVAGVFIDLRKGLTVAAVVGARHLIERWTFNVVSSHSLDWKRNSESDQSYISRAWDHYGLQSLGRDPGKDWAWLSEMQHGRNVPLGSRTVSLTSSGQDQRAVHAEIARIVEIPLRQIRGSILALLEESQASKIAPYLSAPVQNFSAYGRAESIDLKKILSPPEFFTLATPQAIDAIERARRYRQKMDNMSISQGMTNLTLGDTQNAIQERVARIFENAQIAFREERDMTGDRFEFGDLAARLFRYHSFAALAELVGAAGDSPANRAMRLAGGALTSAWNLWLQDSDLSLAAVRIMAEQTAIFRSYRLKPVKAERLSARPELPASRWFEVAGWGRLATYVRALGEFSHIHLASRRSGARQILTDLQGPVDPIEAPHGARREALDEAAYMLAYELAEHLDKTHADLASAFRNAITLLTKDEHEARLEAWLRRAEKFRDSSFGVADANLAAERSEHVATGAASLPTRADKGTA